MNNKMIILTVFLGALLVGFTTGNVVAQEIKIGDTAGTPFVSFEDAMSSGMYEIRLNDGTGQFQIYDITNERNAMIVAPNGNIGVGDAASVGADFVIGCSSGACNIQTFALDGSALNTVKSTGSGKAKIKLVDETVNHGTLNFVITTQNDGTVCMGDPTGQVCLLRFDINGTNPGRVTQTDGTCIANC